MKKTVIGAMLVAVSLTGCTFDRGYNEGGLFGRNGLFSNLCGRRGDMCDVPLTAIPIQAVPIQSGPIVMGGGCCEQAPVCCPAPTCCPTMSNQCCSPSVTSYSPGASFGSSFGGSSCGCSGGSSPAMQIQEFERGLYSEPGVTRVLPGPANDPAVTGSRLIPVPTIGG